MSPPDLMNTLAFMLAAKLAAGAMFRECAHCSDLFEVGRGAARWHFSMPDSGLHQLRAVLLHV